MSSWRMTGALRIVSGPLSHSRKLDLHSDVSCGVEAKVLEGGYVGDFIGE